MPENEEYKQVSRGRDNDAKSVNENAITEVTGYKPVSRGRSGGDKSATAENSEYKQVKREGSVAAENAIADAADLSGYSQVSRGRGATTTGAVGATGTTGAVGSSGATVVFGTGSTAGAVGATGATGSPVSATPAATSTTPPQNSTPAAQPTVREIAADSDTNKAVAVLQKRFDAGTSPDAPLSEVEAAAVQKILKDDFNYKNLTVDGKWGQGSRNAFVHFQNANEVRLAPGNTGMAIDLKSLKTLIEDSAVSGHFGDDFVKNPVVAARPAAAQNTPSATTAPATTANAQALVSPPAKAKESPKLYPHNPKEGIYFGSGMAADPIREMASKQVKQLQAALNEAGAAELVVDGKWGKKTQAAFEKALEKHPELESRFTSTGNYAGRKGIPASEIDHFAREVVALSKKEKKEKEETTPAVASTPEPVKNNVSLYNENDPGTSGQTLVNVAPAVKEAAKKFTQPGFNGVANAPIPDFSKVDEKLSKIDLAIPSAEALRQGAVANVFGVPNAKVKDSNALAKK